MTRSIPCLAVLVCFSLPPVWGQDPPRPSPGDMVRVTAPECSLDRGKVEFQALAGDSLLLREGDDDLMCPTAFVDRLEVYQGRRRWGKGATAGALAGGVAGALAGRSWGRGQDWLAYLAAGAGFGAAMGNGARARKSILIGTGIGAVSGALGGAIACVDESGGDDGPGFCAFVGGVFGASIGVVGGSVIGLVLGEDRWEEVPLPRIQPFLAGVPGHGIGLGVSASLKR